MVVLGIAMLAGFEPKISVPRLSKGGDSQGLFSMFLFGGVLLRWCRWAAPARCSSAA